MKNYFAFILSILSLFTISFSSCKKTEFKDLSFDEKYDSIIRLDLECSNYMEDLRSQGVPRDSILNTPYLIEVRELSEKLYNELGKDTALNKVILSYLKHNSKCPSTVVIDSLSAYISTKSQSDYIDTMVIYKLPGRDCDTSYFQILKDLKSIGYELEYSKAYLVPNTYFHDEYMCVKVYWTANNSFNAPIADCTTIYFTKLHIDCSSLGLEKRESLKLMDRYSRNKFDWDNAKPLD